MAWVVAVTVVLGLIAGAAGGAGVAGVVLVLVVDGLGLVCVAGVCCCVCVLVC